MFCFRLSCRGPERSVLFHFRQAQAGGFLTVGVCMVSSGELVGRKEICFGAIIWLSDSRTALLYNVLQLSGYFRAMHSSA